MKDTIAAAREALGRHPEDVTSAIKCAADALFWLETLFDCISDTPGNHHTRIKHLSEIGKYISADFGNYAESTHEELTDSLRKVGIGVSK